MELVFGGVNQKHYEGCIIWHDLGQFNLKDGLIFEGCWDFKLETVKLGDSPLAASSTLALVDSGLTYVVGPVDAIGYVAEQNQAVCFNMDDQLSARSSTVRRPLVLMLPRSIVTRKPFYPWSLSQTALVTF